MKISEQLLQLIEEIQELEELTNDERVDKLIKDAPITLRQFAEKHNMSNISLASFFKISRMVVADIKDTAIVYHDNLYKKVIK